MTNTTIYNLMKNFWNNIFCQNMESGTASHCDDYMHSDLDSKKGRKVIDKHESDRNIIYCRKITKKYFKLELNSDGCI